MTLLVANVGLAPGQIQSGCGCILYQKFENVGQRKTDFSHGNAPSKVAVRSDSHLGQFFN